MPIAIEDSVLTPLSPGDNSGEMSIKKQAGNFGWLTWVGSPSSPVLATSLTLPGDSDTYVNPDNPADTVLHPGDWAQGSPGVTGSNAVKTALNALINVPIDVPVWDTVRGQGNNYDYHVVRFATIELTGYRLTGNGWLSFNYLGEKNCFNQPPVAEPLAYETNEDIAVGVTLIGSDPNGDVITYSVASQTSHGLLSGTAPDLVYTPAPDYTGNDSFTYTVNDGTVDSAPAVVDIAVLPVNDAPIAFSQQLAFAEDTSVPLTLQWQDVDGDTVTAQILNQPLNATLTGSGFDYTYIPDTNFVGDDSQALVFKTSCQ